MLASSVEQMTRGPSAIVAHLPTTLASASTSQLILLDLSVEGVDKKLRALLDTVRRLQKPISLDARFVRVSERC